MQRAKGLMKNKTHESFGSILLKLRLTNGYHILHKNRRIT